MVGLPGHVRAALALRRPARWRLVMIGLSEDGSGCTSAAATPREGMARATGRFRARGMPFATAPAGPGRTAPGPPAGSSSPPARLHPGRELDGLPRAAVHAVHDDRLPFEIARGPRAQRSRPCQGIDAAAVVAAADRSRHGGRSSPPTVPRRARPPARRPSSWTARRPRPRARSATPPRACSSKRRRPPARGRWLPGRLEAYDVAGGQPRPGSHPDARRRARTSSRSCWTPSLTASPPVRSRRSWRPTTRRPIATPPRRH